MKYLRLPKSRMLRFGIFLLGTFLLSLAGLFGYRAWIFHRSHQQFVALIEHLDATDPNWKLDDYFQSRPKIPDEENAWVYWYQFKKMSVQNYKQINPYRIIGESISPAQKDFDPESKKLLDLNADCVIALRGLYRFDRGLEPEENIWRDVKRKDISTKPEHFFDLINLLMLDAAYQLHQRNSEFLVRDIEALLNLPRCNHHDSSMEPFSALSYLYYLSYSLVVNVLSKLELSEAELNRILLRLEQVSLSHISMDSSRFSRASFFSKLPRNNGGRFRPQDIRNREPLSIEIGSVNLTIPNKRTRRYLDYIRFAPWEEEDLALILMEYSELIYAVEKDPVDLTHWKEYWREKYPRFLETEPLLKAEESKRELQRILKIELFRAVNKRWPNSVEEVPGFPKNIISEYPIRLKPVEQGLIVYRFSETAAESDLKALQEPSKIYINKGFLNPRALLYTKLLNPELRMK